MLSQVSFYRVSALESVLEHDEDLILLLFFKCEHVLQLHESVAGWITVLSRKRKCYFHEDLNEECSPTWQCLILHTHFLIFFFSFLTIS